MSNLSQTLSHKIEIMPLNMQQLILQFVEFLEKNRDTSAGMEENEWWKRFSLWSALKDVDGDPVEYTEKDYKIKLR